MCMFLPLGMQQCFINFMHDICLCSKIVWRLAFVECHWVNVSPAKIRPNSIIYSVLFAQS